MDREPRRVDIGQQLKQELQERGKYYFKDFAVVLGSLQSDIEIFVYGDDIPERAETMRSALKQITELYAGIPFDQITNHPDYDLLVAARDAILKLVPEVEKIINGKKDDSKAHELIQVINQNGQEYRRRLSEIRDKLRQQPGHENDSLTSVGITDGKVWEDSAL